MAVAEGGMLTSVHRQSVKSRNRALISIIGVISGAWLVFRAMGPKQSQYILSDEEREAYRGGDVKQTAGNKTAGAPSRGLTSP